MENNIKEKQKNNKLTKSDKRSLALSICLLLESIAVFIMIIYIGLTNMKINDKIKLNTYNTLKEVIEPSLVLFEDQETSISYFVAFKYQENKLNMAFKTTTGNNYSLTYTYLDNFIPLSLDNALEHIVYNKTKYLNMNDIEVDIHLLNDMSINRLNDFYQAYEIDGTNSLYIESELIYFVFSKNNNYYSDVISYTHSFNDLSPIDNNSYLYYLYYVQFNNH